MKTTTMFLMKTLIQKLMKIQNYQALKVMTTILARMVESFEHFEVTGSVLSPAISNSGNYLVPF